LVFGNVYTDNNIKHALGYGGKFWPVFCNGTGTQTAAVQNYVRVKGVDDHNTTDGELSELIAAPFKFAPKAVRKRFIFWYES
jgi:hypothetical protein